jgi:hypothetical protein
LQYGETDAVEVTDAVEPLDRVMVPERVAEAVEVGGGETVAELDLL